MSEQGWRDFLSAEGVEDWVVLHGGPTAVFKVASLVEAAQLAEAVAAVPGIEERTVMSVAHDHLTIRLTREMWGVESRHIEVARAISKVARERGAMADRGAVQEVQLAVAAKPDDIDLGFWGAVLGYAPMHEDNAIDPLGHGSTVWMQDLSPEKSLRHAMHVDVSVAREVAEERLGAALAAGGRIVDESEAPAAWILADRAGNKVCVASWARRGRRGRRRSGLGGGRAGPPMSRLRQTGKWRAKAEATEPEPPIPPPPQPMQAALSRLRAVWWRFRRLTHSCMS